MMIDLKLVATYSFRNNFRMGSPSIISTRYLEIYYLFRQIDFECPLWVCYANHVESTVKIHRSPFHCIVVPKNRPH